MVNYNELMQNASAEFDPLPSGPYDVEVAKSEPKLSQTGKTMFKVQFKVLTGPHAGRIIFNQFVVSPDNPNALSFFFQHMRVLGLDSTFFAANPTEDQIANALVGRRCTVEVAQREWEGRTQNDVKKIKPSIGVPVPAAPVPQAPGVPSVPQVAPPPSPPPVPPAPAPAVEQSAATTATAAPPPPPSVPF